MIELLKLWFQFSNIPVNDQDEIEESFLHFDVGTDKMDVWKWFEEQDPVFQVYTAKFN